MKQIRKTLLLGFFALFSATASTARKTIFVAPAGSDRASGSLSRPFRTVERALAEAAQFPHDTTDILLRGGTYVLQETVEVVGLNHVTIAPYRREPVVFTGAHRIDPKRVRKVTDPAVRERLRPEVRDRVRQIDARELGIPLTDIMPKGFGRPSMPGWSELFIDGRPLSVARWPNDSMAPIGKIHCTGDIPREERYGIGDPVFEYAGERPAQWKSVDGMWIGGYFAHGYADDMIPVQSIDTAAHTLTAALPTPYGFMTGAPWRRWFALNLLEEIDLPGEYVIDVPGGRVYFLSPDNARLNDIYISTLETPMFAVENSRGVTLRGVTLEYSRGMGVYIEASDSVRVDSCVIRNLGHVGVCIGRGDTGSDREAAGESASSDGSPRLVGTLQNRTYNDVLFNRRAGTHNGISNSYICQTGAGGVNLGGGDRATLTPACNYVENCRIHDFNRIEKSYRPGIWIDGVGNRVSNCEIFDAPSMAILLHGNDHLIEYCDIHDVCREVDDQGAFYYGRDPSEQGNRMRYCYFHDFSSAHRVSATYHDDGACGMEVFGCVYFRSGTIPVLIGGGHDNVYRNNIFIDMPMAVHIDNRMEGWGRGMLDPDGVVDRRLRAVRYTEPPYATAYPELARYWEGTPRVPRGNVFAGNLFCKIGKILNGSPAWADWSNNWVTVDDPGFVNPEQPLQGFVPDAPIYRMIDRFAPIPFERIGCKLPVSESEQ
ncbi:right-handed parallel beta-helix repeat-containing protein [uncultured Rikenella sp.]|uniref:right-handed parallel beta-helix repeat-containing protein n=1 Tax=uncultured Rikenella sp. TaxID=368003 RepID=UPI0025FA5905|nr:right-handed parallel beta-helix repeat-containing protein [uncultured Rikenella sp.]